MSPVGKHSWKLSALPKCALVIQALTLYLSTLLFPLCISVLPEGSVEIIFKELQTDSQTPCKNTHSQKFNFKYNHFCPSLSFKSKLDDEFLENPIQEHPFVQIRNGENDQILSQNILNQQELISEGTVCRFFDKNMKLLAAQITSLPWNFTATRKCRHFSNKFPENHNMSCEIHGESNISLSLRADFQGLTAFFNENSSSYCLTSPKFLVSIFRIQKGAACMVKVQQYKIDLNMTKEKCEDYEMFPTCGLYACSEETNVLSYLRQLASPTTLGPLITTDEFSNDSESMKPFSDFQFQRPNRHDTITKITIEHYLLVLFVLVFFAFLILLCRFKACCRETTALHNLPLPIMTKATMVSAPDTRSAAEIREQERNQLLMPLELHYTSKPKVRCSSKPSCVCRDLGGKQNTKKWGHRGTDDESYAPVRQNDTPYIPSVARM